MPEQPGPTQSPTAATVDALLSTLEAVPVTEHAAVFTQVHAVLQDALADAGSAPDRH